MPAWVLTVSELARAGTTAYSRTSKTHRMGAQDMETL
jgi:hypothetical protein